MLEDLTDAPIAYFCSFFSYALILFVEKVAFNSHSLLHGHEHKNDESNSLTLSKLNDTERETKNDEDNGNEENEKKEPMVKIEK